MILPIPTPYNLLPHEAVITPATEAIGLDGSPSWTYGGSSTTLAAFLQPASTRDAMLYGRETGTNVYTLFVEPTTLTLAQLKNARVAVEGRTLRVVGGKVDPCANGCVNELFCEEDF